MHNATRLTFPSKVVLPEKKIKISRDKRGPFCKTLLKTMSLGTQVKNQMHSRYYIRSLH